MNQWHLHRRTFLRGATGAVLGLPLLDVMAPRSARAAAKATAPIRMGCIYLPNGVPNLAWRPESTGSNGRLTKLNKWLEPFEPLKDNLQFISGMESATNGDHAGAGATWLISPVPDNRTSET